MAGKLQQWKDLEIRNSLIPFSREWSTIMGRSVDIVPQEWSWVCIGGYHNWARFAASLWKRMCKFSRSVICALTALYSRSGPHSPWNIKPYHLYKSNISKSYLFLCLITEMVRNLMVVLLMWLVLLKAISFAELSFMADKMDVTRTPFRLCGKKSGCQTWKWETLFESVDF